jgi:hypothetical protein
MERFLEDSFPRPQYRMHLGVRSQHDDLRQHPKGILPVGAQVTQEVRGFLRVEETQIQEEDYRDVSPCHRLVCPGESGLPASTHDGMISCQLKCPAEQVLNRWLLFGDQDGRRDGHRFCWWRRVFACLVSLNISRRHLVCPLLHQIMASPAQRSQHPWRGTLAYMREASPVVNHVAGASLE